MSMKHFKHERGQSLVELAISLLILLYLLAGAVEFGISFFTFVQLRDAAQEGALFGSLNPADPGGIEARVRNSSSTSPIDLSVATGSNKVIVSIEYLGTDLCEGNGNSVRVTVSYDHKIFMPFLSQILGGKKTIPLKAQATNTILTPPCP